MTSEKTQAALDHILPLIRERLEKEGIAWFSPADSKEVIEKFGIEPKSMGNVYKIIAKTLGVKLDKRGTRPEAVSFMIKAVKENGNIVNAGVRERFIKAYPDVAYAPIVYAAKMRLGLTERKANGKGKEPPTPSTLFRDGEMKNVYNVLARYEALQAKRVQIKRKMEDAQLELEEVDSEIAKYEMVAKSLDNLRGAAHRLKQSEEEETK